MDTAASSSKNVPVRWWDVSEFIKIGSPVEGPFPQCFKDYVAAQDEGLIKLQEKMLKAQDNFVYLRQNHPFFLPYPVKALQEWSSQGTDVLINLTSCWASYDIVRQEEDAANDWIALDSAVSQRGEARRVLQCLQV